MADALSFPASLSVLFWFSFRFSFFVFLSGGLVGFRGVLDFFFPAFGSSLSPSSFPFVCCMTVSFPVSRMLSHSLSLHLPVRLSIYLSIFICIYIQYIHTYIFIEMCVFACVCILSSSSLEN